MPETIFRPNITNENDPIVFQCNPEYDQSVEVIKYLLQAVYLVPGGLLNILLAITILIRHREIYKTSSFFMIYSTDCIVSLLLILADLVVRALLYFTPLCPILAPYFYEPLFVFKIVMILLNHCKASKSIIQIFLVLNRMTCVLFPLKYGNAWKKPLKFVIASIFIVPFSIDWNLAISRVYMQPTFGGFYMEYIKKVTWASQSRFQLIFIIIALGFTVVCTSITFYTLIMLPKRIRNVEKSLSFASAYISMSFIVLTVFQVLFAFFSSIFTTSAVFGYSLLSYDILNVGSPIIMICVSKKLRCHVFGRKEKKIKVTRVFSLTGQSDSGNNNERNHRRHSAVVRPVNSTIDG
ncbi:CBN-SRG-11 protein [Caenorhabditis brenneri]|uniref:Serpentine receptor class gamma n=1 Tax=Caenorhabditis brenneri TaxID=135651 RepID=G0MED1_CAEBE|nr:CBN-SRG-11 protein [Caenorhabditis brenneri]